MVYGCHNRLQIVRPDSTSTLIPIPIPIPIPASLCSSCLCDFEHNCRPEVLHGVIGEPILN